MTRPTPLRVLATSRALAIATRSAAAAVISAAPSECGESPRRIGSRGRNRNRHGYGEGQRVADGAGVLKRSGFGRENFAAPG
jgi:hypothetical protein